uniref:Uncharacterized protein n=1 Tax=Anguilla anguilla TaxID=7936 RepID=A0A0E9WT58_ANGAN
MYCSYHQQPTAAFSTCLSVSPPTPGRVHVHCMQSQAYCLIFVT